MTLSIVDDNLQNIEFISNKKRKLDEAFQR